MSRYFVNEAAKPQKKTFAENLCRIARLRVAAQLIQCTLPVQPGFGLLRNSSGFVILRRDKPPRQASLWLRQFPLRSAPMACPGVKKATKFLWLPL
jgi:hypothetical protein